MTFTLGLGSMLVWKTHSRAWISLVLAICTAGLVISFAALGLVEVYSKRSSIGCVYPMFALTWHIAALLPATIETALSDSQPLLGEVGRARSQQDATLQQVSHHPDQTSLAMLTTRRLVYSRRWSQFPLFSRKRQS